MRAVESEPPLDPTRVTIHLFDREQQSLDAGDGWIELRSSWDSSVRFSQRAAVTSGTFELPSQKGLKVMAEMAKLAGVPVIIDPDGELKLGGAVKGYAFPPLLVHVVDGVTGKDLRAVSWEDATQSPFGPDAMSDPEPLAERIDSTDSPFHVRMGHGKFNWVQKENVRVSAAGYAADYFALQFGQAEQKLELFPGARLEVRVDGVGMAPPFPEKVPENLSQEARKQLKPYVALYRIQREDPHHGNAISVFDYATSEADPALEHGLPAERAEAYRRVHRLMLAKQVQEHVMSPEQLEIQSSNFAVKEGLTPGSLLVTLEYKKPPTEQELDHLPSRHFWGWMGGEVIDCAFLEVEAGQARELEFSFERVNREPAEWTIRAIDAETEEPLSLARFDLTYRALPNVRAEPILPERIREGMEATFSHTPSFGWLSAVSFEAPWYAPYFNVNEMAAGKQETILRLERATGLLIRWLDRGKELDPSQGLGEEHFGLFEAELVPITDGDPIRASFGPGCSLFSVGEAGTYHLRFPTKPPFQNRQEVLFSFPEGEVIERVIDVASPEDG